MCCAEHLNSLFKKDAELALGMFQTKKSFINCKGDKNIIHSWFSFSVSMNNYYLQ